MEKNEITEPSFGDFIGKFSDLNRAAKDMFDPPILLIDEASNRANKYNNNFTHEAFDEGFKAGVDYQAKQQPVSTVQYVQGKYLQSQFTDDCTKQVKKNMKTLQECKDEVAKKLYGNQVDFIDWNSLSVHGKFMCMDAVAELYASSKAVDPQQGWIDVEISGLPEEGSVLLISSELGIDIIDCYIKSDFTFDHYIAIPEPPTKTSNQ